MREADPGKPGSWTMPYKLEAGAHHNSLLNSSLHELDENPQA